MVSAALSYVAPMTEMAATSRCPRGPTPWRCQPSPQLAPQRWTDPAATPPRLNWWQRSAWSVCSLSSWPCSSSAGCPCTPLTPGKHSTFARPTRLSLEPPSRSSTCCPTHLPASTPSSTALWTSVFERRFSPLSLAAAGPAVEEASGKVMMRSLPPERPCLNSTTPLSAQWDHADSQRPRLGKMEENWGWCWHIVKVHTMVERSSCIQLNTLRLFITYSQPSKPHATSSSVIVLWSMIAHGVTYSL